MILGLDHVVIVVSDLERAVQDYRALGFTVAVGGRHPGRGSRNALVVFEDGAYLELFAYEAPSEERRYKLLEAHGEGIADFALLPESTAHAIDEAKARGLALDGPIDGGRVRPDGRELKWQLARARTPDLPFLCGDLTPRELRVPSGEGRRHANGALGVSRVTVAVANLQTSLARYRALLGAADVERGAGRAALALGDATLVLEEGLPARGEGARALALRTALPERAGPLDRALAHQADIELVAAFSPRV